jgi:hypothetical protein
MTLRTFGDRIGCREPSSLTTDSVSTLWCNSTSDGRSEEASLDPPEKRRSVDFGTSLKATVEEAVANVESSKEKPPKRILALPDLEHAKYAVLNTLTSKSGQRTYDHAITEFVEWYCSEPRLAFNRTVVLRYRISLEQKQYAPSTINRRASQQSEELLTRRPTPACLARN